MGGGKCAIGADSGASMIPAGTVSERCRGGRTVHLPGHFRTGLSSPSLTLGKLKERL